MDFKTIHLDAKVAKVMKRIYHVKTRAKEIFNALDLDESGYVDEDEFISGQNISGEIN